MRPRVFLDSNVFIYAFEDGDSNSRIIIDMLTAGEIEAVVSERVIREVMNYFRTVYGRDHSAFYRDYLLQSCAVVYSRDLRRTMASLRGAVKDKDLEQLAAARALSLRYLVSLDRHFEGFGEYITPRDFVGTLGLRPRQSDY
ncbi:MAG: type II toxin-antitoxin system VapC family toxin [Euryarchaeota archaeon]|nr:type II toxin-antitoxin system VapC family toxin [Euryarchaeota archaeon]